MVKRDVRVFRKERNVFLITEIREEELNAIDFYNKFGNEMAQLSNIKTQISAFKKDLIELDRDPLEVMKENAEKAKEQITNKLEELEKIVKDSEENINLMKPTVDEALKDIKIINQRKQKKENKKVN